jgi:signal transduction histidine kinase
MTNLISMHQVPWDDEVPDRDRRGHLRDRGVFSVLDHGIGIDPQVPGEAVQDVLPPAHQEEFPGTGIGLAISEEDRGAAGGKIWFESERARERAFYFTVPSKSGTSMTGGPASEGKGSCPTARNGDGVSFVSYVTFSPLFTLSNLLINFSPWLG